MKYIEIQNNTIVKGFLIVGILVLFSSCKSGKEVQPNVDKPIQLSEEVRTLRNEIMQAGYIGTEQTNRRQGMDPNFAARLKLMRIATTDELLTLSGDTSAVVALTAFDGLYKRDNKVVPIIFKGFIGRSDIIHYINGDLSEQMPMLEYAYVNVMHYTIPNEPFPDEVEAAKPKFELSDEDQNEALLKIAELRAEKMNPKE